jgi:hypothetical protein
MGDSRSADEGPALASALASPRATACSSAAERMRPSGGMSRIGLQPYRANGRIGMSRMRLNRIGMSRIGMSRIGMSRIGMSRIGMSRIGPMGANFFSW